MINVKTGIVHNKSLTGFKSL